jgi:hypothetical protein
MELVDEEERVMRAWLMEKLPLARTRVHWRHAYACVHTYEYERGRRQFWQHMPSGNGNGHVKYSVH